MNTSSRSRWFLFSIATVVVSASGAMAQFPASRQATLPGPAVPPPPASLDRTTFGPAGPAPVKSAVPVVVNPAVAAPAVVSRPTVAPVVTAAPAVVPAGTVAGESTVAGQVLRTKQVDLRGSAEKNLVALVDVGGGRQQIVELGLAANFKATPVYSGDAIVAQGLQARLGQLEVLAANRATIGGKEVAIVRETRAPTVAVVPKLGYPVTEQVVKIDGRVNRLRMAQLAGSQQEHLIAELVTRGGQAIVTDLGPRDQNWRADIKQGEWITIRGQEMKIDNRPAMLALEINKNGVPVLIDRHLVRGQATEVVPSAAVVETAAVVRQPAVVTPPTTLVPGTTVLVPGTTVEQTTPVEVVPPRVSPPIVVPVVP